MDSGGFDDLLHQAQQLTADMDTGDAMPRVERSLFQIRDAAVKMAYKAPCTGRESSDVKASLLLGSRGYDLQKSAQKLEGLSATKTFEPLEPVRDTDIQGFLKNERENALLAAIEQSRKTTLEETNTRHWKTMECEWEKEKQRILTSLIDSTPDNLSYSQEPSLILDSTVMQGRSMLDSTEMAYSRQVFLYNESAIQGGVRRNLVDLFAEVARQMDNPNAVELWSIVQTMINVPMILSGSLLKVRTSPALQSEFVKKALGYLQRSYKDYIEKTISSNLQQAQRGGVPGTYSLVRSFLNIRQPPMPYLEDGHVDDHPVWSMIYYCMRCGDLEAAMQVITKARQFVAEFGVIFQEYKNNAERSGVSRLTDKTEREVRLQYHRIVKTSTDPYKKAVYCIIGRCDAREDHGEIVLSTDDYLWMKLMQVICEDIPDDKDEFLTLTKLQTMFIEEFGEAHFDAYQKPFLYFRVLFLTGQFESAIEFLARLDSLRCYAVHISLVLHELQLLLTPNSIHAPMLTRESSDPGPVRRLNFARLIMMYTRKFEVTDPREALQYFYFLRDFKNGQGDNLLTSCISELVLETKEFDMLLGQLLSDGTRRPGAIDKFQADTQKIIEQVAQDTEVKGQFEDAVKLYDLAQDHNKVVELLNRLLSQVLSQAQNPQSNRDRIKQMALSVAERYSKRDVNARVGSTALGTFHLQLDLMNFFDCYHSNKFEQAYNIIQDLRFLPFSADAVEQKVHEFRNYSDEIRRCLPDILLATMTILLAQYRNTKGAGGVQTPLSTRSMITPNKPEETARQNYIGHLRSQAQALITFAGMIPYRMPGDTNARLVQMEVVMN